MTDDELCGILRGPDAKYFASKAADRIEELNQRPDASAGLIEAAEYCEKEISRWSGDAWSDGVAYGLKIAAQHLRGAADRSGK